MHCSYLFEGGKFFEKKWLYFCSFFYHYEKEQNINHLFKTTTSKIITSLIITVKNIIYIIIFVIKLIFSKFCNDNMSRTIIFCWQNFQWTVLSENHNAKKQQKLRFLVNTALNYKFNLNPNHYFRDIDVWLGDCRVYNFRV